MYIFVMDNRFFPHNLHLESEKHFLAFDPHLSQLKKHHYVYLPPLLEKLPFGVPGIYTLGGGRQIGKTTLLKQWMARLMAQRVSPLAIAFFSGELIDDHHALLSLLQAQLSEMPQSEKSICYLLLDEVTYIRDWDKAIKYAADAGWLENVVLLITGSDWAFIQEARMRFPGRRGKADKVDFHLYPLSFREFVQLKHKKKIKPQVDVLFEEFNYYLLHGGYLTAINDIASHGKILTATLMTYSDWIRGDILRRGRHEHYLREIVQAIIKRYGSQITWNALAQDLSIDHPKTVADYIALLASMDAVFIQDALLEDKLTAAPKKARKLMFTDPFIFHALRAWLFSVNDPYQDQVQAVIEDPVLCSKLVEACVVTHYRRFYPTYYIKAEGEVDIAYVDKERFWPIEIKWTQQLHIKNLKQVSKYANAKILTKTKSPGIIQGIETEPLPLALWNLGEGDGGVK